MSVNVHAANKAPEKLLQLLEEKQSSVAFVQEVSPPWAAVLDKPPVYPYRKVWLRQNSFGLALRSKHPLEDVTAVEEGEFGIPAITATLTWEGKKVALRAVHPHPPIKAQAYVEGNRMLADHAVVLVASGQPAIMAGDFNAKPRSAGVSVVQDAGCGRRLWRRPGRRMRWCQRSAPPTTTPSQSTSACCRTAEVRTPARTTSR